MGVSNQDGLLLSDNGGPVSKGDVTWRQEVDAAIGRLQRWLELNVEASSQSHVPF